jgi:DNA-binding CsgD family transcriptional regulator
VCEAAGIDLTLGRASRPLLGRHNELAELERFVAGICERSAVLFVEGEPGIGKTTLWGEGRRLAGERGYSVLACRAVESEAKLGFAGLGDLLEPVLDEALPNLPAPQRRALEVALLRAERAQGSASSRAVAVACLNVLRWLALRAPVLVAVDDFPWLDAASRRVLDFALRRLDQEAVGFLLAARRSLAAETSMSLPAHEDVRRLRPAPLGAEEIGALVRSQLDLVLPSPLVKRLHDASGGNPFFALEIARALARGDGRPGALPLPENLRELVRARLAQLPAGTRQALLYAAALAAPTVPLVSKALGRKADGALAKASEHGVIRLADERILFTHPLLASTLYADAPVPRRRTVHRRVAAVVPESEQQALHLARASSAPDADVADAIEEGAERAEARGAQDTAADLFEWAATFTPGGRVGDRLRREIKAAECLFRLGETRRARRLLETVTVSADRGPERARALYRLGVVSMFEGDLARAELALDEAAAAAEEDILGAQIECDRAILYSWSGDFARARAHIARALELGEATGDPERLGGALELQALDTLVTGRGFDRAAFDRARDLRGRHTGDSPLLVPSQIFGAALLHIGEVDEARRVLEEIVAWHDERGEEQSLPFVLATLAWVECRAGDWRRAYELAMRADALGQDVGQPASRLEALLARALVEAHLGDADAARRSAAEATALAGSARLRLHPEDWLEGVLGFLELSLRNLAEARSHFQAARERFVGLGFHEALYVSVPDEVEVLVGRGELERAEVLLDQLEQGVDAPHRRWVEPSLDRSRALLLAARRELPAALERLERAQRGHELLPFPFELGRTLLAKGIVERRAKRRRAARESLSQALAIFERLGARLWAEQAQAELRRIGGRAPRGPGLTATEERVAELAAQGRTNREIAATLFLSVNTVQAYLKRAYRELGVRSRTELAASFDPHRQRK